MAADPIVQLDMEIKERMEYFWRRPELRDAVSAKTGFDLQGMKVINGRWQALSFEHGWLDVSELLQGRLEEK